MFDRPLAASAGTQLSDVEDGGFFAPTVTLASGARVEDAEAALAAEIARVRDTPVTAAELAEAKNEMLAAGAAGARDRAAAAPSRSARRWCAPAIPRRSTSG